jgi:uncharacterized protein (TIGR02996 family)
MSIETVFLHDVLDHPDDDSPRLVYADWLEDNGQPERAELIRVQCELARVPEWASGRHLLKAREQELWREHNREWSAHLPRWARTGSREFRRGFVARVEVSAGRFFKEGEELFELTPLEEVCLSDIEGHRGQLAECPALARLSALDLSPTPLRGPEAVDLVASSQLDNLTTLKLRGAARRNALVLYPLDGPAASLPRLRALHVWSTVILPDEVRRLRCDEGQTSITKFELHSDTGLSAEVVQALVDLPQLINLRELCLATNLIRYDGLRALARSPHLANLTVLDLSFNWFGGQGPEPLTTSPLLTQLSTLRLRKCDVGTAGARAFADSPLLGRLRVLGLSFNGIDDEGARALAESYHLRAGNLAVLDLSENNIGNEGARAFAEAPYLDGLSLLDLRDNLITDTAALRDRFGDRVLV